MCIKCSSVCAPDAAVFVQEKLCDEVRKRWEDEETR